MRMWMVPPKFLCIQHLNGEHKELHMLIGAIKKNKSLKGYILDNLVQLADIEKRHEELVNEYKERGYISGFNHQSVISDEEREILKNVKGGKVDIKRSFSDLVARCYECERRIINEV